MVAPSTVYILPAARKERVPARQSLVISPYLQHMATGNLSFDLRSKNYANHPFPTIREIDPEKPAKNNIQPYFLQQPRLGFWPGASSISTVQH